MPKVCLDPLASRVRYAHTGRDRGLVDIKSAHVLEYLLHPRGASKIEIGSHRRIFPHKNLIPFRDLLLQLARRGFLNESGER